MTRAKKARPLHACGCEGCAQHPYSRAAQQHQAVNRLMATLDEKGRRRLAGLLASQLGRGGLELVHAITGLSRVTIRAGREELGRVDRNPGVRRAGGGRKAVEKSDRRSWRR